jgi:hypothetical protein
MTKPYKGRKNMKFKMKTLVVASALVFAGSANAAIDGGSSVFGQYIGEPTIGEGELFLSVVARNSGGAEIATYALDLGVTANQFYSNSGTFSYNQNLAADANWTAFQAAAAGAATVNWTLAGNANGYDGAFSDAGSEFGFLGTHSGALTSGTTSSGTLSDVIGNIQGQATQVNLAAGDNANYAANNSVTTTVAGDGISLHDGTNWGADWMAALGDSETAYGDSSTFYLITDSDDFTNYLVTAYDTWSLSGDTLSYGAVPVPAAVWLLGSALVGLVGVSRRRQSVAVA